MPKAAIGSNHEYFAKVVRRVYHPIGDTTEHGFVFRVDLALRPNGSPAGRDLAERAGRLLPRPGSRMGAFRLAEEPGGRAARRAVRRQCRAAAHGGAALRVPALPGLQRFDALRRPHRQIRDQAARRSAGHPERANDVKLSRGGIREIEFIVQLLQVVRGGQFPELRTCATLTRCRAWRARGTDAGGHRAGAGEALTFLRRVEHRIQYLDDQQTHAADA